VSNLPPKLTAMTRTLLTTLILLTLTTSAFTQASKDEAAIRSVMANQVDAWNKGNIDAFMKGYWNNDSLVFIGKSGLSNGYHQALANYKKNYSGSDQMGKLFFDLLKVKRLSADYYFVIGKWFLKRKAGDIGGVYTLLFHKINGLWRIVVDHTS
jgi:ketosteroid isomerase-like protein